MLNYIIELSWVKNVRPHISRISITSNRPLSLSSSFLQTHFNSLIKHPSKDFIFLNPPVFILPRSVLEQNK
ncbi:hypothetical protein QVD17_06617 [Tagetes erecta]|uniref:Uncharacterized protein n=1 Tax=Tagetes erecta TaxID=13708 RepID=A0AAD8LL00_TARER|nr:hypothetical protein QVD17_06617 [Tagetes erecta]